MENNDNERTFLYRFLIYQKERFPFIANGVMIGAFTFSAAAYSVICRGKQGFIDIQDYLIGVFITVTLFFLVRIFDEFKDKEDDAKYRQYLPVPRGLVSLKELGIVAGVVIFLQLLAILTLQPKMFLLYVLVIAYLLLMRVEFFVPKWLKERQVLYITSHMVIIPLIDMYASGLDWLLAGAQPHYGLLWFFAVSYMNGIVLEFGRKLRAPEHEELGVVSYTGLYGTMGGTIRWIVILLITLLLAVGASHYAGFGFVSTIVLSGFFLLCVTPAVLFLQRPTRKYSKMIEYASALWTALMYLALGGIPMLYELF